MKKTAKQVNDKILDTFTSEDLSVESKKKNKNQTGWGGANEAKKIT